ncbi:hypothetical protein P3S68_024500 [Capsicum galapagoense]
MKWFKWLQLAMINPITIDLEKMDFARRRGIAKPTKTVLAQDVAPIVDQPIISLTFVHPDDFELFLCVCDVCNKLLL